MDLNEFFNLLLESGSPKTYDHYTTFYGLIEILRLGYIKEGKTFANLDSKNSKQISVLRPSGSKDITSIAGEENSKLIAAKIQIQFEIANDKIRNMKIEPINEPVISFDRDIDRILSQYKLLDRKKEIISNIEKHKEFFSDFDYKKLHNKIYNYL